MLESDLVRPTILFSCNIFFAASVSSIFLNLYLQNSENYKQALTPTASQVLISISLWPLHPLQSKKRIFHNQTSWASFKYHRWQQEKTAQVLQVIFVCFLSPSPGEKLMKNEVLQYFLILIERKLCSHDTIQTSLLYWKLNFCNACCPLSRVLFWASLLHLISIQGLNCNIILKVSILQWHIVFQQPILE